ncbi:MAG: 2-phospho-L-lactate transferase [Pseudomonadales bacterium]|nr:2-phospho-L-lactate transferase [Pseudomonadales bacterium]NIX07808.1 2-phospho-L-lactate transferase [Pseudomonadales bacterium]
MSRYLAITGGVGGAKLGLGLAHTLNPDELVFAVNTGDDFEHLGLHIAPDVDTLTYTLAGLSNTETGWGRADETWNFMDALDALGGETWFRLGDRDLALHVARTQLMSAGASLSEATSHICEALGVAHRVLPMSDDPVRTTVHTDRGPLTFQHYFVRERCEPAVTGFDFAGIDDAQLNPAIRACLNDLRGIILCPSNPFVSVDPMLNLPGARAALKETGVPIVAVSPIVGGTAIKGPTAKMMRELEVPATAAQVAEHYGDLLTGFVLDEQDEDLDGTLGTPTIVAQTVMVTLQDRVDLGRTVVDFIEKLS